MVFIGALSRKTNQLSVMRARDGCSYFNPFGVSFFKHCILQRRNYGGAEGGNSWHTSSCGVPQGSVLGPLLFVMYTTPLSTLISSCSLNHHLYAYDTQLFLSFLPTNMDKRSDGQFRRYDRGQTQTDTHTDRHVHHNTPLPY